MSNYWFLVILTLSLFILQINSTTIKRFKTQSGGTYHQSPHHHHPGSSQIKTIRFENNAEIISDPNNKNVTIISDPINKVTISDPIKKVTISDPINKLAISDPINNVAISDPINKVAISDPINNVAISDPIKKVTISDPINKVAISDPINNVAISDPINNVAISDPINNVAISDPINNVAISDPINNVVISDPINNVATSDPINNVATSDPINNVAISDPNNSDNTRMKVPTEVPVTYNGDQVFRVIVSNSKNKKRVNDLVEKGVAQRWGTTATSIDIMIKQDKVGSVKQYLEKAKLSYEIVLEDVQRAIDEENPDISEEQLAELTGRKGHKMTFHKYHRMDDIHGYLDYLAQTYPQLVQLIDIGKSIEGRPLRLVKISSGQVNSTSFWIDGGIHAREWITPAVSSYVLSELVENRDAQDEYLKKLDFYILPIVNPDGYEYAHTTERLWRKNRRKSPKGESCSGIDLNRNWGFHWGGVGSSKEQCQQIYSGTAAFSEPETQAVSKFILSNRYKMRAYVSFHSYGQYILYPWGYNRRVPPDYADLDRVGRAAAEAMLATSGGAYTVGNAAQLLYPAAGASDDWAKGVAKIKYTYTIELRDQGKYGFLLPSSHILPVGKEAFSAVKAIAREINTGK